jgi:hypothetical protein
MFKEEASAILGVSPYATLEQAKEARTTLLLKYHPDNKEFGDSKKAQQINEAFEAFSKPFALALLGTSRYQIQKTEKIWEKALNNWELFETWFDTNIIEPIEHTGKRSNMIELKAEIIGFLKTGSLPTQENLQDYVSTTGIVNVHNIEMKVRIYQNMLERFNRENQ